MTSTFEQQVQPATATAASVGQPAAVIRALCSRELVRFFRQRNRVVGALGQPLVFWILFAAGLGPTFRLPGEQATVS
ncbi:MAG TPA: hypothetical protein VHY20_14525, partial [Pirellulales bacterium]|nr:hypothetical protein [Pirellulales bacterium]